MDYNFSPVKDFGNLESAITALYGENNREKQVARYRHLLEGFNKTFGERENMAIFSAPGRTEIGGNHTDHQHGKVLAGSVNLDIIAAVAPNNDNVIRIQSEGFHMNTVDLSDLAVHESDIDNSDGIVRGVAARFAQDRKSVV